MNPIIVHMKALAMQPSTWRGLAALAGLFGIGLTDGAVQAVSAAVIALLSAYDVLRDEYR